MHKILVKRGGVLKKAVITTLDGMKSRDDVIGADDSMQPPGQPQRRILHGRPQLLADKGRMGARPSEVVHSV